MSRFQQNITRFIQSGRDYPVLAGLVIGYYLLVFYYSNNFDLANSWQQFAFLLSYFAVIPAIVSFGIYKTIKATRFALYARQALFITVLSFFAFFVLQNLELQYSYKKIFLLVFACICLVSFRTANYKAAVLFILLMSVFPSFTVAGILIEKFSDNERWDIQPDSILEAKFKTKPNVYYIQTDGYTSASTLKNPPYSFDNSDFETWLTGAGFKIYPDYRSNYSSTLTSNASAFNMLHHFGSENSGFKNARDYIMGNPVIQIFKNNGYKTFFLTESPYLLINRPSIQFDFCNYDASEIPFLKDGWSAAKDFTPELKSTILSNRKSTNFFFIEKFDPGHIAVTSSGSTGKLNERILYLNRLQGANAWLKDIVGFINANDPGAMVIIGADHGGFVGLDHTQESYAKITDPQLLHSIFGANLAIRWSEPVADYDNGLKSAVNLFRTVIARLSANPEYLKHLQPDVSYNHSDMNNLDQVYIAIPAN